MVSRVFGRRCAVLAWVAVVALSAGCANAFPHAEPKPVPSRSGLELSGYDRTVRPADDLYRSANGTWLSTTPIPPELSQIGSSTTLALAAQADQRALIEAAATNSANPDDDSYDNPGVEANARKIGDLYASYMDTARLDQLGVTPLAPYFAAVDGLSSPAELIRHLGDIQRFDASNPIGLGVSQDAKNATAYITNVGQGGLSLPGRDYYLSTDPKIVAIRTQYRDYTVKMLTLAGQSDPAGTAGRILDLETKLAQASWTNVANRDALATYNKFTVADATKATGIDWGAYLDAAGIHQPDLVIEQPPFFSALSGLLTSVPLGTWKQYLKWHLIQDHAPYLSSDFVTTRFDFVGTVLGGLQQNTQRWRRGVIAVNSAMGEALGQLYVQKYFPAGAKARADALVHQIIEAYRSSITGLDWMSPQAKSVAEQKLDKLAVKIGYPTTWKDYSSLVIKRDDLIGDLDRAFRSQHQRQLDKLGKPVDRTEWSMTPQTVNAYYDSSMNEIVFPAAILQRPFFDPHADDAVNYGAIGAVIGHEISHAFDDQGSKYDPEGNLRDWWTPADAKAFAAKTQALTAQYNTYSPLPGQHINGALTLGENIADLSGLTVANRAYQASLRGNPAPVIDGFTGDQRFFLGFAQIWRTKQRPESERTSLLTNPHSPDEFRCNGVVPNIDAFYQAFNIQPGDKLYKAPSDRIHIW
jgi:predicted metalloendopeptidase